MKEIEDYLDRVCRGVAGSPSLRQHIREELREHLLESRDRHLSEGLPESEAAHLAIEEFGEAKAVSEELQSIYGRRLVALLIEKAMAWKEGTMKTSWKWGFVANLCLLLTVVAGALLILGLETYIVPMLTHKFHERMERLPAFAGDTWTFLLFLTRWSVVWVPLLLAGVVAFERLHRGENKPRIRLAMGAMASLLTMGFVFLATAAVAIPLAMLPASKPVRLLERLTEKHAEEAAGSFAHVQQAMEQNEPWRTIEHCGNLRRALRELEEEELTPLLLAHLNQKHEIEGAMRALRQAIDLSNEISWNRDVEQNLPQLVAAFDDLVARVGGWPKPKAGPPRVNEP